MTEHVVFAAKVGGTNPAEPITRRLRPFSDFRYYRRGDATAFFKISAASTRIAFSVRRMERKPSDPTLFFLDAGRDPATDQEAFRNIFDSEVRFESIFCEWDGAV